MALKHGFQNNWNHNYRHLHLHLRRGKIFIVTAYHIEPTKSLINDQEKYYQVSVKILVFLGKIVESFLGSKDTERKIKLLLLLKVFYFILRKLKVKVYKFKRILRTEMMIVELTELSHTPASIQFNRNSKITANIPV